MKMTSNFPPPVMQVEMTDTEITARFEAMFASLNAPKKEEGIPRPQFKLHDFGPRGSTFGEDDMICSDGGYPMGVAQTGFLLGSERL